MEAPTEQTSCVPASAFQFHRVAGVKQESLTRLWWGANKITEEQIKPPDTQLKLCKSNIHCIYPKQKWNKLKHIVFIIFIKVIELIPCWWKDTDRAALFASVNTAYCSESEEFYAFIFKEYSSSYKMVIWPDPRWCLVILCKHLNASVVNTFLEV